jgi:hypothetical protein
MSPSASGGGTAVVTAVRQNRLSHRMTSPPPVRMSWPVRVFVLALLAVVGGVLWVGVPRGLSCRDSVVHPHVQQVSELVQTDQKVLTRLATGTSKSWTLDDGAAVLTADRTMLTSLTGLKLSKEDTAAVASFSSDVRAFDAALTAYMSANDDTTHAAYAAAANTLQQGADTLSTALAGTPARCHLS